MIFNLFFMFSLKFKIDGMHCVSCAMNIDGELEELDGVTESKTNYAKSETAVLASSEDSAGKILEAIKKLGYKAEQI